MVNRRLPSLGFWAGKRVFLTGHTGFKGGWLSLWLSQLGAVMRGYALPPSTTPNFFTLCDVQAHLHHQSADIRDTTTLSAALRDFAPDIVFHLAAQPLVRASYARPLETYATNIMGTVFLLDAISQTPSVQASVIVTSDKVYAENARAHVETSPLGGHDPYSASKACTELVTASFPTAKKLASVRAGNVIGGGDWSADRLLPDFFRAIFADEPLKICNPRAIRPWQHVLDPLCGYLLAAEHVWHNAAQKSAWNFAPAPEGEADVETIAVKLCAQWPAARYEISPQQGAPHEAPVLRLNAEKAQRDLAWQPRWDLNTALIATADWYRACHQGAAMADFSLSQIEAYCQHD